jgi:hypothetical protein
MPFLQTISRPNSRFTIQIDEIKQNVPIDGCKICPTRRSIAREPASPSECEKTGPTIFAGAVLFACG